MAVTILTGAIIVIIIANTLETICARHSSKCFSYREVHLILTRTLLTILPLPHKARTYVLQKELLLNKNSYRIQYGTTLALMQLEMHSFFQDGCVTSHSSYR